MTGDEYMQLLLERQAAWVSEHPMMKPWAVPLLEWFVREDDDFTPPEPASGGSYNAVITKDGRVHVGAPTTFSPPSTAYIEALIRVLREREQWLSDELDRVFTPVAEDRAYSGHKPKTVRRNAERQDRQLRRHSKLWNELHQVQDRIGQLALQLDNAKAQS
jgi:hypothetical protein